MTVQDNALHCETRKVAYRQTKDGVVVSFVIHPNEVPDELATAPLGARYMLVLVEINDDETPKSMKKISLAQEAGMICAEPAFLKFLEEKHHDLFSETQGHEDQAAECVRLMCGVGSRSEIIVGTAAAATWRIIAGHYRAWQIAPSVVPEGPQL